MQPLPRGCLHWWCPHFHRGWTGRLQTGSAAGCEKMWNVCDACTGSFHTSTEDRQGASERDLRQGPTVRVEMCAGHLCGVQKALMRGKQP